MVASACLLGTSHRHIPRSVNVLHRYVVESRLMDALDTVALRVSHRNAAAAAEWKVAYEGRATAARIGELQPRAAYRFRVRAVNGAGHGSPPSALAQVATAAGSVILAPRRAGEQFSIDAAGDLVVGDTVLFTERLLIDRSSATPRRDNWVVAVDGLRRRRRTSW
mmetsp:Transcript_7381/g.22672  ORF Transcript_7381/g.22672 Transcript_7381/m.22672 type:complete len:165 (-) Transcript_7381:575-1069(-)